MLQDRVILVTGGLGVLGRATVQLLAEAGARVVAIDLAQGEAPDGAALLIGGVDGADPAQAAAAVDRVRSELGMPAALVNIAGGFAWETISDGNPDTWDRLYRMNLRSALVMCQAVAPLLAANGGGAIVNIGAAAAARAGAGMGAYTASKSGVARLTEALAEELKDSKVRVNAVLPSILDTPANRTDMPDADTSRWVRPESLAQVVGFLLSDAAADVTGAGIPVTGRV